MCQEDPNGLHRLLLLLLRGDRRRQVPLLGAVVAELGVVTALDLHGVLRIVDVVLHALVEGAIDGQSFFQRIVAVEVDPQQDEAVYLIRIVCGKLGGHGAAHGVPGHVPVLVLRKLLHHRFRYVGVKNRHAERYAYQNAGNSGLPDLVQQGLVSLRFYLDAGVEDDGGVGRIRRGEDGQIILHFGGATQTGLPSFLLPPDLPGSPLQIRPGGGKLLRDIILVIGIRADDIVVGHQQAVTAG